MCHFAGGLDREQLYALSAELKRVADMLIPIPSDRAPPAAELVRRIIRVRRIREEYLGTDLFADPAWDMLLDLFAARLEHGKVSVSSLCLAAAVPPTTALRWIALLESKGHVERHTDAKDRRRVFVEISDEMAGRIEAFIAVAGATAPILL